MYITNSALKRRILQLSYKHKLSHIGSCITAVDIIDEIYSRKGKDDPFILSAGHAGLALYVVIEKYEGIDAEKTLTHHGIHPDRCADCHLHCSTGSLGHGLGIAVGMALADRTKTVWCMVSDGECAEGSIWEALRVADEQKLDNLVVYVNANGYGAYKAIDTHELEYKFYAYTKHVKFRFHYTRVDQLPFLKGLAAHYHVMSEEDYQLGMEKLR